MKLPKNFKLLSPAYGDYQIETINFGIQHNTSGLLLDTGLGKTFCAINVARFLLQKRGIERVLVVCPTSIMYNWHKSISNFSEYNSIVLHGNRNDRLARFRVNSTFYIINYEGLTYFFEQVYQLSPDMIIFDESSRYLKRFDPRGEGKPIVTRNSIILSDKTEYKQLLTATLIDNKPLDLWSQFRILDGGSTFGTNFYRWRNIYFTRIDRGRYIDWKLRKSKVNELNTSIYKSCIRFKKEEVLDDLPDSLHNKITLPFSSIEDVYVPVRDNLIEEIEEKLATGDLKLQNVFTKLLKLQQITGGFLYDGKSTKELSKTPKLDATEEQVKAIIDEGNSVIIWCRFRESIRLLAKRLKKFKPITMSGEDNTPKKKYNKWGRFQNTKCPIFIGQISSGGVGIELFKKDSTPDKSQYTIYYENEWNKGTREQAEGRILRIGQKSKCIYTDIIIEDTIDERILNSIQNNMNISEQIMSKGIRSIV